MSSLFSHDVPPPHPASAIILAGGRSRRMGSDKALLTLPTSLESPRITFIEHLTALLTRFSDDVVIVARDAEQRLALSQLPRIAHSPVRLVSDSVPDMGPLMGLYTGLSAIHNLYGLVTAVDTPLLQPALLTFLLSQPRDDALLIPITQNAPQVMLALYPRSALPIIEARLHAGRRDPRSLLDAMPVHYIEEPRLRDVDPQLQSFINVNTREQYDEL